jgi:transcriptional regulator GlxA family with amidase domain
MVTTGIVLFDDAEELDFAGPWEVFTVARQDGDRVVTVAQRAEPVRAANGLRVLPDHSFADCPELDVILVPGGQGTRREVDNPVLLVWLAERAPRATWLTSVCTGSLVLWGAGLTIDRRVTTHWAFVETLRGKDGVTVVDDERWVVDGNLVTSAGVSAGIDMSLWIVGQLYGESHARQVQLVMEYDPAPPWPMLRPVTNSG